MLFCWCKTADHTIAILYLEICNLCICNLCMLSVDTSAHLYTSSVTICNSMFLDIAKRSNLDPNQSHGGKCTHIHMYTYSTPSAAKGTNQFQTQHIFRKIVLQDHFVHRMFSGFFPPTVKHVTPLRAPGTIILIQCSDKHRCTNRVHQPGGNVNQTRSTQQRNVRLWTGTVSPKDHLILLGRNAQPPGPHPFYMLNDNELWFLPTFMV